MHGNAMAAGGGDALDPASDSERDAVRRLAERLPRPARFLGVGGLGLITDLGSFTLVLNLGIPGLIARIVSLALATLVTWRLNRALTFDRSGRRQHREAVRYAAVTAAAQGTSYAIFAILTLTLLSRHPQAAIVIGAACSALISYNGHRLFAFAPVMRTHDRNIRSGEHS
ncbi:GtrA family protein [Pseudorhodoplanes sp.]|jgi:putative flippase GtrA|uniref:GtrA family protein n=1 Tax=Pseudorhodoplanes sp. TaxID=1934341 RepID=UPI002BC0D106|nr:GtrA family protein [Pseudorhodoplanes sp.]HWV40278.1 GtrA family protein [Pseudorhodoplanes sp.]